MKSLITNSVLLVFFLFSMRTNGKILYVPQHYATIQAAIDAAANGDTVLVGEGRYFENINFLGKKILVTSMFLNYNDVSYIPTTIIDGSKPINSDKASCVLMVSGEDSSSILQGFTLTGGKGTKWVDEHGAGTYVEGGGILTTLSSPTIRFNIIVDNEAISTTTGITSAGGGAIRCGDGSPHIYNNVILDNKGMYGGGIVLNYCSGARIVNNVINANKVYQAVTGKQTFGGGGIWVYAAKPGDDLPNIIENNTVVGNSSNTVGGGIRIWSAAAQVRNNIIWKNFQTEGKQLNISDSSPLVEYNDIEDSAMGIGNFSLFPVFTDSSFILTDGSPCIDAGDPSILFADSENPSLPGFAKTPAKGSTRNDIGAYGGPMSSWFPNFSVGILSLPSEGYNFGLTLPNEAIQLSIPITNLGASNLEIDSVIVQTNQLEILSLSCFPDAIPPMQKHELMLTWVPSTQQNLVDTLLIFHHAPNLVKPFKVSLTGSSIPQAFVTVDQTLLNFGDIDVNVPMVDTIIYVHNSGTLDDSVYASILYQVVKPDSALELLPKVFKVAPKDSIGVLFRIYPPRIKRTIFNNYQPIVVFDSKFSTGIKHFQKTMKFHLIGTTDVNEDEKIPTSYSLSQNFPNPFNPNTTISFSIANPGLVSVKIFDVLGEEIMHLVNEYKNSGNYSVNFEASGLSSGIYFYTMNSGNFVSTKKMIVLK